MEMSGTVSGMIELLGGGEGEVKDVQVKQTTEYTSVVDEEKVAKIDLSSYINQTKLNQELSDLEGNIEQDYQKKSDMTDYVLKTALEQNYTNNTTLAQLLGNKQNIIDYSTEEQNTGIKWIDGKPLYQKTINFNNQVTTNKAWTNNICGTINSGIKIVNYEGWFGYFYQSYTVTRYARFEYYRSPDEYYTAIINDTGDDINVRPNFGEVTMTLSDVTIWYTKTTDTAEI